MVDVMSLWGEEFSLPNESVTAKSILSKVKNPKEVKKRTSKKLDIRDRLQEIYKEVKRILGRYAENTVVIKDKDTLHNYINKAIENGIIAVDTETNKSLDPLTCKLMGPCIYTYGMKNAYIPINHVNIDTRERLGWQLTEKDIHDEFSRLEYTKIVYHNAKFDYQVIKCTTNTELGIYWDTFVAAKILDENESSYGLKQQYIEKIDASIEKYSIEHLFKDVEYELVDPDIFALYAATDPYMTLILHDWQWKQYNKPENKKLLDVLFNIEFPIISVASSMELTGVALDEDYCERLSKKYNALMDDCNNRINNELMNYRGVVDDWKAEHKSDRIYAKDFEKSYSADDPSIEKKYPYNDNDGKGRYRLFDVSILENPINTSSPSQLAIFLYDILKVGVIDPKNPRGTGEGILKKIDLPIARLILEQRGLAKLVNTYIDKLPSVVSPVDGRLHAHFNTLGAETGRFSSSDPNL